MSQQKKTTQAKGLVNKLVEVLSELEPLAKKHRNVHFGYNYISEGDVMAALRTKLSSRGVFLFTSVESITPQYQPGDKGGVYVCVQTKHTFVDTESNEKFVVLGGGLGWDSTDKGAYKAITGATKYALMKNFLVTDEQDAEATDQAPPAGGKGHRRTRPYEEETGAGDTKVNTDLLELKAFLTEHQIPDGFLLQLLLEKKLIDSRTKNVAQLKPGILHRCIQPKTRQNLLDAWNASDKGQGASQPQSAKEKKARKKVLANKGNGNVVRTTEGDQTARGARQPCQTDIAPADVLEQEGYENWRKVIIPFGKQKGMQLGKLGSRNLSWWIYEWVPEKFKGSFSNDTVVLDAALCLASAELGDTQETHEGEGYM